MTVMIVGLDFKPNTGGIAELTHNIAVSLQNAGAHVVVLSNQMDGAQAFDSAQTYDIIRCELDPPLTGYRRRQYLVAQARQHLRAINPEVVICNSYDRITGAMQRAARSERTRFVVFVHGLDIALKRTLRHEWKKRLILQRADGVIANSNHTRELAIRNGARPKRTHVVTPGISPPDGETESDPDSTKTFPETLLGGSHTILSVGRLIPRKGFDTVIGALPDLLADYPGTRYVLIGDGPDRSRLESLAVANQTRDCVTFLGAVDESTKNAYYRVADVFAMPNRNMDNGDMEGFGIVFLEANLFGKPVIGGKAGGVPDAIEHGKSGFLVDPIDGAAFTSKVGLLFSKPELAQEMGRYGRRRATEQFDWTSRGRVLAGILSDIHN